LKAIAFDEGSPDAIELGEEPQPGVKNRASPDQEGHPGRVAAPRDGTKLALVIEHLQRADGATIIDLTQATGWLPHTRERRHRAAQTRVRRDSRTDRRWRFDLPDLGRPAYNGDRTVPERHGMDGRGPKQKETQAA
jgi:hypothetical protein